MNSLHFADNANVDKSNRLFKIDSILHLLNNSFYNTYSPDDIVCIDESIVPFRGRVILKGKRHKFGIKLFKLCSKGGYTNRFIVYARRDKDRQGSVAESIVMRLMNGLLDCGRKLSADNFYSSIPLAETLIARNTHYAGTLRKNRIGIPKEIVLKKLKKNEDICLQNNKGITIMKWRSKRDVLMLSTFHNNKRIDEVKPYMVNDYNQAKGYGDLSDQMAAYTPFIRKTCKWYLRLFMHLTTQMALVNAWVLFCKVNGKIGIKEFKSQIIEAVLTNKNPEPRRQHKLIEVPGPKRQTIHRCTLCSKRIQRISGSEVARAQTKKINTKCNKCDKHMCLECFQKNHLKCL